MNLLYIKFIFLVTVTNKKSKKKDENEKPKTPTPPFFCFLKANRSQILQENPGLSNVEVGQKGGEMWKSLSEQEKNNWKIRANEEFEEKLRTWSINNEGKFF